MAAHEAALGGKPIKRAVVIGDSTVVTGTVDAALAAYYTSGSFKALGEETRKNRRRILENFRNAHGRGSMAGLSDPKGIEALQLIIDDKTPAAAKNFRKAMSGFLKFALTAKPVKLIPRNPLADLTFAKLKKTSGHLPWSSDEMDQYADYFEFGTKARLAFELLLQLGQSKCDIVRIGPQHVKDGMLVFSRKKTGVEFTCKILPPLKAAIDAMGKPRPIKGVIPLTYMVTEQGKPFSAVGFSNKLREWCDQAGLPRKDAETSKPRCTAHGLRKSSATRMADLGANVLDLMGWYGWKTPSEAIHYVETANKRKAANRMAAKVEKIERAKVKAKNKKGAASVKPEIPV